MRTMAWCCALVGTAVLGHVAAHCALLFSARQSGPIGSEQWPLVLSGTFATFAGVVFGKRYLHKITMKTIQSLTGAFLLIVALGGGLV